MASERTAQQVRNNKGDYEVREVHYERSRRRKGEREVMESIAVCSREERSLSVLATTRHGDGACGFLSKSTRLFFPRLHFLLLSHLSTTLFNSLQLSHHCSSHSFRLIPGVCAFVLPVYHFCRAPVRQRRRSIAGKLIVC